MIRLSDDAIGRLGLYLRAPAGGSPASIHDVQIWSDGSLSLRLSGAPPTNGSLGLAQSAQPARE